MLHDPYTSTKYLGWFINSEGNNNPRFNQIHEITTTFSKKLKYSNLSTNYIFTAYTTIYLPKLRYLLTTAYLTQEQTNKIKIIILDSLLPLLHINIKSPRKLIFEHKKFGGIGFVRTSTLQGYLQTKIIIQTIRSEGSMKKLLYICCDRMKLEYGSHQKLVQTKFPEKCYVSETWLLGWWMFLSANDLTFEYSNSWNINHQREHDQFIMDSIYREFPKKHIKNL